MKITICKAVHKYYKRIGSKGKYKYFYTKAEYNEHLKEQESKKKVKKKKPIEVKKVKKPVKVEIKPIIKLKTVEKKNIINPNKPVSKIPTENKPQKEKIESIPETEGKQRFSPVREIPRSQIGTSVGLFQGRNADYSEESVNKIVSEGYDKSNDPIIVWHDKDAKKYIVISGHSRFEASRRLYEAGDKSLAKMPVKEFNGSKESAVNYAVLESNRASTNEGFLSDVKAVGKMLKEGMNRNEMLKYVKPKSYLEKVINYTYLNPKGKFIEYLDSDSKVSFPYIERNADWVGTLKNMFIDEKTKKSKISDAQENEIFDYIYNSDKKGLGMKKDELFNLIKKKVNNAAFSSDKPLNLKNIVSTNAITGDASAKLKTYDSDISELSTEIERKQDLAVRATIEGNHSLAKQFKEHINNLHEKIIDTKIKKERLKSSIEKVENIVSHDLFS